MSVADIKACSLNHAAPIISTNREAVEVWGRKLNSNAIRLEELFINCVITISQETFMAMKKSSSIVLSMRSGHPAARKFRHSIATFIMMYHVSSASLIDTAPSRKAFRAINLHSVLCKQFVIIARLLLLRYAMNGFEIFYEWNCKNEAWSALTAAHGRCCQSCESDFIWKRRQTVPVALEEVNVNRNDTRYSPRRKKEANVLSVEKQSDVAKTFQFFTDLLAVWTRFFRKLPWISCSSPSEREEEKSSKASDEKL